MINQASLFNKRNGPFVYIMASLLFLLICLVGVTLYFSHTFYEKDKERIELQSKQIKSLFKIHYKDNAEELWTKSYTSIRERITRAIDEIGGKVESIQIFTDNFECVGSIKECRNVSFDTKKVFETSDSFLSYSNGLYRMSQKFTLGGVDIGYMKIQFHGPFTFSESSFFAFSNLGTLLVIFSVLFVWGLWTFVVYVFVLRPFMKEKIEIEKSIGLSKIAKRIAHDIRSPVEVLKSVTNSLEGIDPEYQKLIMGSTARISEIANGLLSSSDSNPGINKIFNLKILLEEIIAEKKVEKNVDIVFKDKLSYESSFICGVEVDVYRSISNLINNGVEAQKKGKEKLDISVENKSGKLEFILKDYGRGMDNELLSKVLLGGKTTKKDGNGIGLSSSKSVFESLGAEFKVVSKVNFGTSIYITIPLVNCPSWFTGNVTLNRKNVVCIDDDDSFRRLYKRKFKNFKGRVVVSNDFDESLSLCVDNSLFFFDYDLGKGIKGIDRIVDNSLQKQSVLVTSMYQDEYVQNRCLKEGIKILPKQIFNNANFVFSDSNDINLFSKQNEDVINVLIDDDRLVHAMWKMCANKAGESLRCYFSVNDFLRESNDFNSNTKVYVDSCLGDGLKGEVESRKIFDLGFKQIYLETGFSPREVDRPHWIKGIIGKEAPW